MTAGLWDGSVPFGGRVPADGDIGWNEGVSGDVWGRFARGWLAKLFVNSFPYCKKSGRVDKRSNDRLECYENTRAHLDEENSS